MQQQPGGGQFGGGPGSNQNYYLPAPSPYQQQGTPMSSFVHSPGTAIEHPSPGGGVYSQLHQQQQQQQPQQLYQYMTPSPAQPSELQRSLGFGSAPASVGSPMAAGSGSNYRQPSSIQQMLPPTPQPPTPRGPQTPASVGPVGGGDYGSGGYGGPGSVNPATPRSVGDPLSVSDQQQQMSVTRSTPANTSFTALLDQDSNSQIPSPQQPQQHQQQPQTPGSAIQGQQQNIPRGPASTSASMDTATASASMGVRGQNAATSIAGMTVATEALQNLERYGPLVLCSMGKELTQELVMRTADMFVSLRTMTDPNSQFPRNMSSAELAQQLEKKERQLNESLRQTAILVHRLVAVCIRLEQISKDRLPADAQDRIKDLLPYISNRSDTTVGDGDQMDVERNRAFLDEIRLESIKREEYQSALVEHEKARSDLVTKRDHLRQVMDFLRQFCWEISMVLDTNSSSA